MPSGTISPKNMASEATRSITTDLRAGMSHLPDSKSETKIAKFKLVKP